MNKRCMTTVGAITITASLAIFAILILSLFLVSALEEKYTLGEKVKIEVGEIGEYSIKIKTPNQTLVQKSDNPYFVYLPKTTGSYNIQIESKDFSRKIIFEVINPKEEKTIEVPLEEISYEKVPQPKNISKDQQNNSEQIILSEPVKWTKKISSTSANIQVKIPKSASNISLSKTSPITDFKIKSSVEDKLKNLVSSEDEISLIITNPTKDLEVQYETPGPESKEKIVSEKKKVVEISSDVHYENVLAYTNLTKEIPISQKSEIQVYWLEEKTTLPFQAYDTNNNSLLDYIEWTVPHLSTQTFEIILISKADLLDEDKNFIESIFGKVSILDGIFQAVPQNNLVRITFEEELTYKNDITIYAKSNSTNASIEVYEKDSSEKIAEFEKISDFSKYKILLTNLPMPQKTFDLLIKGAEILIDLIIDPSFSGIHFTGFEVDTTAPWDGWVDGGTDCLPSTSLSAVDDSGASGGSRSIEVQDDTSTSYTAQSFDLSSACNGNPCDYVLFSLYLRPNSYDAANEGFFIYCDYNTGTEVELAAWAEDGSGCDTISGVSVCEDTWTKVEFNLTDLGCTIDNNLELRVSSQESVRGLGNGDQVYIDGINLTGYGNSPPTLSPVLNSTLNFNMTTENLTCYPEITDIDSDPFNHTTNWILNSNSFTTLNLPFNFGSTNTTTTDYSGSYTISSTANYISSGSHDSSGYYQFDGSSSLTISSDMSPILGGTATVMFWMRTTQTGSDTVWNTPGIIGVEESGGGNDIFWGHINAAGNIGVTVGNGNTAYTSSAINDGSWHHIAMTRNSSTGLVQIYLDGSLDSSATSTSGSMTNAFDEIGVIEDTGGTPVYYAGDLDDFMAFPRILSPEQISALYNKEYDTIVSTTTIVGEVYSCQVRANDGLLESSTYSSNSLTILPYSTPINIGLETLSPLNQEDIYYHETTQFVFNVTCLSGDCGTINVTLDPIQETFEDFESGEGSFAHEIAESGKVDDWHRSSESSNDGTYSFKAGDTGTGDYSTYAYGALITPSYSMSENSTFSFYHYLATEAGYDGAKLEYSLDGGSWTKVTNFITGGYNDQYQSYTGGPSDWTNGEDIWSDSIGSAASFSEVEVNLSSLSGNTIQFRFLFGSDSSQTDEGWYIDSVNFTTQTSGGSKGIIPMNSGNPFYTTTSNPYTTAYLNEGDSETVTFNVNTTGTLDSTYTFFAYANATTQPISSNITETWNMTIKERILPVSIQLNSPTGTINDPTPILNATLLNRTAEAFWYNLNGSANQTLCTNCIGEISELLYIDSEGTFNLNLYTNNSNGDITYTSEIFTIDLNNNFYDTFLDNHSVLTYGETFWDIGSINYTAGSGEIFLESFEASTSVTFPTLIDYSSNGCQWYRDEGGTSSSGTGPSTGNTGSYYIYMETSNNYCSTSGDQAIIESIPYNITGSGTNLSFYYHMYGSNIGTLSAEIYYDGSWIEIWSLSNQQQSSNADSYDNAQVSLDGYSGEVQIRFIGIAVGSYQGDMAIDDVSIIESYSQTEIVSRPVSTIETIAEFINTTWNLDSSGSGEVKLQLSVDNGSTWKNATQGLGLTGFTGGTTLKYKAIFEGFQENIDLLDLNISWTNTPSPAPDVTINYPTPSTFPDVTPILNFDVGPGTAANIWYTINGGSSAPVCSSCSGSFNETLYLEEGSFTINVYSDNSIGEQKSDSVTFNVNMNGNYFDTYLDDSQVWGLSGPWWELGNVTYQDPTGGVVLNRTFDSASDISDWTTSSGTWQVTDGQLRETSNVNNNIVIYNDFTTTAGENYNITLEYFNGDDDESGIIFRYIDTDNYYKCSFKDLSGPSTINNNEGLTIFNSGTPTVFDTDIYDLEDQDNTITVSIVSDNISCYLNGILVYSVFDNSWDGGKVGIINSYDTYQPTSYNVGYDAFYITTWEDENPSFTSYPIHTAQDIVEVLDVSWNDYEETSESEVSVQISTDGGTSWHEAQNGQGLGVLEVDNDLVYKVFYDADSTDLLSLLDLNITWTHSASPPPTITISHPADPLGDTTPEISTSISGPAQTYWYEVNGGTPQIICTTCSAGNYSVRPLLEEDDYIIIFYANNSVGTTSSSQTSFEVNMNRNYFDTFLDDTQIMESGDSIWQTGSITYNATGMGIFENFDSGSLSSDWTTYVEAGGNLEIFSSAAHSGSSSLLMDSDSNALKELITAKDFSGAESVTLDFYYTDFADESAQTPADHTGTRDGDAVYFTCDGSYWYMIYNLQATSVTDGNWNHVNIDVSADPDFCATVDSNFAIKFTQYDNADYPDDGIAFDDINISIPGGRTSVIGHPINVSQTIKRISNVEWTTSGETLNNQISVELSVDSGTNWYEVTSGSSLESFAPNSSLVYRINFSAVENTELSFLDLNITWEEPPTINIQYPENNYVYNFPITKMNYTISVSGSETLDTCWYTADFGTTNTTVTCGSEISVTSVDGVNTWKVFANDSSGSVGSDTVQFIIDTSAPQIYFINQSSNPVDEGGILDININVTDSNIDSVWIVIWDTVVGGTVKFMGFFSDLVGDLFNIGTTIDPSYNLSHNYTIYANDTTGLISNYSGTFDVLKAFFTLDHSPVYADGTLPAVISGYLGLTSGSGLANHPFNIWLEGTLVPFTNITANGNYLSDLNFTGSEDLFSGSLLENVSDAGGYLTLDGTNTSGSMKGIMDAGALVNWDSVSWNLLTSGCSGTVTYYDSNSWGYSGTSDTYIDSAEPTTSYATDNDLIMDTSPSTQRTLLKFEDIFGFGLNKIPYDSSISSGELGVTVYITGNAPTLYEILEDWEASSATYNSRLPGLSWSSTGLAGSPSRSTNPLGIISASTSGQKTLDITDLVRSWNNRSKENYGVVFNPGGSSGVQLRSSEYITSSMHPMLEVDFSSTDCAGIEVYYRTSQDGSAWSEWVQVFEGEQIQDDYQMSRYLEYDIRFGSFSGAIKPNLQNIKFNYTATVTDDSGNFNYNITTPTSYGSYLLNLTSGYRTILAKIGTELRIQSGIDPVVTLLFPQNNYWSNLADLTILYNATDLNDNLESSTLFVDGIQVKTNETAMINGGNEFDYTFTEGHHNWSIRVDDDSGLFDQSETRDIYIDLTDPSVTLHYPSDGGSYTFGETNLSFTPIDNMDENLTCNVTLDGTNIYENQEFTNGTIANVSSGAMSGGTHLWNATCSDNAGRTLTSETREFTITDTPPSVSLLWPTNNEVVPTSTINFTFFPDDNSGITVCDLFLDGSVAGNITNPELGKNSTIEISGIPDGFHNWSVSCVDYSSSTASTSNWTFGVDTIGPTIELFNLPNNYVTDDATPNFDIRVTDAIDSELSCQLVTSDGVFDTFNATSGARFNFTSLTPFLDEIVTWYINCTDDSGYSNNTASRNLDVRQAPTIQLDTANQTHLSSTDFSIFYTPSDNGDIASCSLYIDGSLEATSASITKDTSNLLEAYGFANGIYDYYITCTDTASNTGTSTTQEMTLDTLPPTLLPFFPLNQEVYATNITFNFTAYDIYAPEMNCSITVDGVEEESNIIFTNNTNQSITISGISDGTHYWNLTCQDFAGNQNTSETYNFTRFTAPGINLISPANETWLNYSDVSLTYYPMDDEGFTKAELYLNGAFDSEENLVTSHTNNYFNKTLSDGIYTWRVRVTDLSLMPTDSETRTFYVDTATPTITTSSPIENQTYSSNNMSFTFTVSDNLDSNPTCDIYIGSSLEWTGQATNATEQTVNLLLVDGNHTYKINCSDEAGNQETYPETPFTIFAPPKIDLVYPSNNSFNQSSTMTFSYTPIDALGLIECSIYLDSALEQTSYAIVPNVRNNFTISGLTEGTHTWAIECTDTDMNVNTSETRIFTRDITAPTINLTSPANLAVLDANSQVTFSWTPNDTQSLLLMCDLYVDGNLEDHSYATSGFPRSESVSGLSLGPHTWNVTCEDVAGNIGTSETRSFTYAYPDFLLNETSISISNENPLEDEQIQINATVFNVGASSTTQVKFYAGDPETTGVQIGTTQTISIPANSANTASIMWDAPLGLTNIYAIADFPDSITELDENNNKANKTVSVQSWHFFYGSINAESNFTLSDSSNYEVSSWDMSGATEGNIYVADSDSIISWSSLQAIGRTTSGTASTTDIQDLDSALSMTSFKDAHSSLYLDGSFQINETLSFQVFARDITLVPVTNSIDSSNFKTGILWDTSDDSNSQYDTTEKEDIVYVTKLNKGASGSYETADYELRVPANLRSYDPTNSQTAVFYVEII